MSDLLTIPDTRFVVLKDDTRLTPWALENGSLKREAELAELPAVQSLTSADVVLDIGAYIGDTALIFRERGADVWAFEPYKDAFDALRINCPDAHAFNVAVGDGSPLHPCNRFGENNGNHGTRMMGPGGAASLRIDDLKMPRVTFVKIDVEGCEPMVLDGMMETIKRCRPTILIEVYDRLLNAYGFKRHNVLDRLHALGYEWSVAIGREQDERLDYLAVPKS